MKNSLGLLVLISLGSLQIYDSYQSYNLSPALKIAKEEIASKQDKGKHNISDRYMSLYPIGSDKSIIVRNLGIAGFKGRVANDPSEKNREVYFGQAHISTGIIGRFNFYYYTVSVEAIFNQDKFGKSKRQLF